MHKRQRGFLSASDVVNNDSNDSGCDWSNMEKWRPGLVKIYHAIHRRSLTLQEKFDNLRTAGKMKVVARDSGSGKRRDYINLTWDTSSCGQKTR